MVSLTLTRDGAVSETSAYRADAVGPDAGAVGNDS